jgi:hypothetical protein
MLSLNLCPNEIYIFKRSLFELHHGIRVAGNRRNLIFLSPIAVESLFQNNSDDVVIISSPYKIFVCLGLCLVVFGIEIVAGVDFRAEQGHQLIFCYTQELFRAQIGSSDGHASRGHG